MREVILELDYATKIIKNLSNIWIQPLTMSVGYMLCYSDDVYGRGIIYRSKDLELLRSLKEKFIREYVNGSNIIRL